MANKAIQVLVVAGYDLLARSVRDILDEAGMRVDVSRSVDAALAQLEQTRPHVLILDGHFVSNGEGLAPVERLRAAAPEVGMILLACRYDYLQVTAALQRGVDGYLYLGDRLARQLPEVVADVMAGEAYVSPTVVKMFAYQQQRRETVNQRLSAYQRDVLRLMTQHLFLTRESWFIRKFGAEREKMGTSVSLIRYRTMSHYPHATRKNDPVRVARI